MRVLIKDDNLDQQLSDNENHAWTSVKSVVKGFLGKHFFPENIGAFSDEHAFIKTVKQGELFHSGHHITE